MNLSKLCAAHDYTTFCIRINFILFHLIWLYSNLNSNSYSIFSLCFIFIFTSTLPDCFFFYLVFIAIYFSSVECFFFSVDFDFIDFFVMGHRQFLWFICPIFLRSRLTARWKPSCLDFTSVAEYKLTLSVWFLRHFDFYLIRYCVGMFYVVFKFSGRCEPMCL